METNHARSEDEVGSIFAKRCFPTVPTIRLFLGSHSSTRVPYSDQCAPREGWLYALTISMLLRPWCSERRAACLPSTEVVVERSRCSEREMRIKSTEPLDPKRVPVEARPHPTHTHIHFLCADFSESHTHCIHDKRRSFCHTH